MPGDLRPQAVTPPPVENTVEDPKLVAERIIENVERVIIGKTQETRFALITMM